MKTRNTEKAISTKTVCILLAILSGDKYSDIAETFDTTSSQVGQIAAMGGIRRNYGNTSSWWDASKYLKHRSHDYFASAAFLEAA